MLQSNQNSTSDDLSIVSRTDTRSRGTYVGSLEVKPQDQQRISLGSYDATHHLRGFRVEITPDPNPDGSAVSRVTSVGSKDKYRLFLYVANYGNKKIKAEAWKL